MIPYTEVRLDMGHDAVVIEGEGDDRRSDDSVHLVQIYGFEKRLQVGPFAYDGTQKLIFFWCIFTTVAMLLLLAAVVLRLAL